MIREIESGGVWIADLEGARGVCEGLDRTWEKLDIRKIIRAADNVALHYHTELPVLALPMKDHSPVPMAWFDLAVEFDRAMPGGLLIHCNGGKNRSVCIAAAVLISRCYQDSDASLSKVLEHVGGEPTQELLRCLTQWAEPRLLGRMVGGGEGLT